MNKFRSQLWNIIALLFNFIITIFAIKILPDQIPVYYTDTNVYRYGSRYELFLIPTVAFIIYLIILYIYYNYIKRNRVYKGVIEFINFYTILTLLILQINIIYKTLYNEKLNIMYSLGIIFFIFLYHIGKMIKKRGAILYAKAAYKGNVLAPIDKSYYKCYTILGRNLKFCSILQLVLILYPKKTVFIVICCISASIIISSLLYLYNRKY